MKDHYIKLKDIVWNTLGTCSYAIVSLLLSLIIINFAGKIDGGIFSFGFSTLTRLTFIITFFGIRPLHIVDVKYKYSFINYRNFGLKAGFVALFVGLSYIAFMLLIGNYTIIKFALLFLLIIHGILDGFSDYYECEYQRVNRLYLSGKSQFFRIMLFAITLIIILLFTKSLLIAEISAIAIELFVFFYFNIIKSRGIFDLSIRDDKSISLFIDALPLFLITFLDTFIFSLSKFFIDAGLGDVYNGFYNIVFMPTNAIYLLMTLIMKPLLTPLANAYHDDREKYNILLKKATIVAIIIALFSIIVTIIFGKYYLSIMYYLTGNAYKDFGDLANKILLIVIVGGTFYTICTPQYFALIIENKRNYMLISYTIVSIISLFVTWLITSKFGIIGAAYSFLLCMFMESLGIFIAKFVSGMVKDV